MHSHILFGVDDGPGTLEESILIIEKAIQDGITDIIVTPHAYSPYFHVSYIEVLEQVRNFKKKIKNMDYPIAIHTGQEIRLHEHMLNHLLSGQALSLADSRYVLLELPSQSIPRYTLNIIKQLIENEKIPIIAHPERNRAIAENPEQFQKLVQHGALGQITTGSLAGHFGKTVQKLALQLVQSNLIHTLGSDVHNLNNRPLLFNEGLNYLSKKNLAEYAEIFLENNRRIIRDIPFIMLEPLEIRPLRRWSFIG